MLAIGTDDTVTATTAVLPSLAAVITALPVATPEMRPVVLTEATVAEREKIGVATSLDVVKAKVRRLEAEIALERTRARGPGRSR